MNQVIWCKSVIDANRQLKWIDTQNYEMKDIKYQECQGNMNILIIYRC